MATEADIPGPASLMERGGVYRHLNLGEFDHPPETVDYLVKSGHIEVSSIAEAKTINSIFEANGGVTEGVSFNESPSTAKVPEEETKETQDTCQAEKQIKKDENFKAAEETVSKESEDSPVTEEIAEKDERSHEISDATRISLEEDNIGYDSQKEEEGERKELQDVELETKKEGSILEASPDIHSSESLDTCVETYTKPCLDSDDKGSDSAEPIEKIESEKEGIRHVENEEASSTVAASLDFQNNEEASSGIVENVEKKLDISSVTLARDNSITQEAEDKIEEKFSIANEVESQDTNNSNQKDMTPLLDETAEKSHMEIPEAESSGAEKVKHVMNTEKKLDSLVTEHVQVKQNIEEEQAVSEVLSEDSREERGTTVVADEDSIVDAVTAPEHSKNEPQNEKLQTSLEMVAEKTDRTASGELSETIVCAKEDTSIGNQEESFDKKEKEEKSVDIEAVRIDRILKQEDLPPTALHDETEITEAAISNKNEDELNAIHSLQKEKVLVEGEKLARDGEEHDDNDSQACESTMKPSLELPSEKGTVTTEPSSETSEVEIETLKAVLLDTEEISETADAEKSMKENIKVEACESTMHNLPTSDNTKSHAEEAISHKVGSSAFLHETIEKNVQAASVQEVATPLKDEVEENEKATSIINEEVSGNGEADDEPNMRHNAVHLPSEIIIQERVESSQLIEKEVDVSKGEDSEGVSQESVEGTFKNTQDDENETVKSSSREMFEKSETAETIDSSENDENPGSTLQCSLGKEQESQQSQNLTVQKASLAEDIDEDDGSSIKKDEGRENYDRLAKADEQNEVILKGREDSEPKEIAEQLKSQTVEETGAEIEKDEITNEINSKSLSQETVAQDPAKNFQNNDNSAEKSDKEVFVECKAEGTGDSIAPETNQNDPSETIPFPLADRVASSVLSETITYDRDDTTIKNQEESFEKKEIEEKSKDIDATRDDEIKNLENLPPIELNEKIEIAEVEITKKNIVELNETRALKQELEEVSDVEPQDHIHKENEAAKDEEKHDENDFQGCESTKDTNLEQPCVEDAVTTERSRERSETDIGQLEKVQVMDTEEKLKTTDAAMNVEENVKKKEEACDCETEIDKLVTSVNTGKRHTEEVTSDKSYDTAFTETVEQNFQPASLHEASPTLKDELGFNEDTKSIISEEITGAGEVTDEQNKTNNVTDILSEVVNEDTVESTEQSENEAVIYKGEDTKAHTIGGINASGISQESVGEKPINISHSDENNTEKSSDRKIFEKSDTAEPVDCTATETKESDESPNLVKEQESQKSQNLTIVEASSIEKIEEDGSSIKKDEEKENDNDNQLAEVEKHNEVILKGEDYLEQTSQKNETKENIDHPLLEVSAETEASSSSRTDAHTVEEVVESPECNEREAEIEKEEEFVNEGNIKILPQDPVKSFSNDNINAEQSNIEIFEKSEIAETVDGILTEAKESHQSPDIVKEQENQQTQNLTILGASSIEKTGEDRSSIKKDEDREDDSGLGKVEEHSVISAETQVGVLSQIDHNVVGEGVESPQCNEREVEIAKNEEVRNESNIESLPQESTAQDPVKNFLNDDNSDKKSDMEIFEKSETGETVDGIVVEEKQTDKSPKLVKEQEILQSENLSIREASLVEKIDEDGTSIKNDEDRENETPPSGVEEHIEMILKDKDGIKKIFQQNELKENIEHPLNVMSAESEASASSQTDDTAVEDDGERPHCNERELEMEKVENVINEIAEDPVQSFHNDDIDAEKSNTNIFEKSETDKTVDSIVTEVGQNNESNDVVKEQESLQSHKVTTLEASSVQKIDEDESSIEKDNIKQEKIEHNEVILKGEEDLEETLQKNEYEPKENIEPLKVISAETQAGTTSQPDDNAVEEEVEKLHCKETQAEMEKDEDIINESNVNSISQVSVAEDPGKNFQNDDNSAETSNAEVKIDRIENNESLNLPLQASLKGEQESMQSDNQTSPEASTVEEKYESGFSPKPDAEDENNTESEELKVLGEKQTLKGKEDLEEVLQKAEPGENLEQSITRPSAETEAGALSEVTNNPVEEMYESPQFNSNEACMPIREDDTQEEITNEQNFNSLPEESVEQVTVKNFQNEETNTEVSNKEIFESVTAKTNESIAVEMNQNNESPNASHPVVLIKEEETPQDKNIGSAEAFPDEEKEDDGSLFIASEDNESETKLVEAGENSKKQTSHGEDNIVLELQNKKPGELLISSRDVISAETTADTMIEKVDDIIFPKEVGAVQNTEENLEVDLQKNEPGELLEPSTDVITTETKGSMLSGKDSDIAISDEGTAIQNTEETADSEKKEDRNEDIDGNKVEKISTKEDLKPAAETCDPSTSLENESGEERLTTSEMEVETTDEIYGVDSVDKLESTEMSKNKEDGMTKDDIGEVERDTTIAGLSEDTEKHIIMEAETTTDISTQSSKEETNLIYEDKAEEKEPLTVDEKEIVLDSVVTTSPRDDTLNLVEKRDHEIPAEACEDKEDTKHEIQNKALIAGNGDQEMPSNNNLIEHSAMSAKDTAVSELQFVDTGIENTNEHAASYQSEDLNQQESCKSKISEDIEASNVGDVALKTTDSINADRKNGVLEEEDSGKKTEASLEEDDAVEKAAIQLEAEAGKQEAETTEIKSYAFPTEENFEASESRKELDNTSEIMTRDQSVDPKEVEKTSISESVEQSSPESQESQKKIEEKAEPKFEAEDHSKQTKNAEETIEAAILTEKVQKEIEKADRGDRGDLVNLFNKGENDLMKINTVSTGDERFDEVTESSSTSTEYVKPTDSNGKAEIASSEVQETETIGKETSNTKEKEEIDADEVVKKTLGFSAIAPNKNSEEVIKKQIREEIDDCYYKEEVTMDSNLEIQTDGKPVEASNFPSDDSNLREIEAEASQQDSMALEENSSNLASQLPTDDHENIKQENVATSSADVDIIVESTKTSDVVYESKFNDVELRTGEIKDENEEAASSQGDETVARSEVAIDQTLAKENEPVSLAITCKEEEYETKVTTENLEESTEKVSITKDDSPANSSALEITEERYLQNEKPRELEGKKGTPDSPNEEYEEKGEALNEIKEEIREASETVSGSKCHELEVATGDEVPDDKALQEEQSQIESCALPSKEQELGSTTKVEKTEESLKGEELLKDESKTSEEVCLQKEESREPHVSELELDSPNEAEKEARVASVEIEDKKDASQSIPQFNSEGKPKEYKICTVQANPVEKPQDQNQTPSSMPLSSEQEEETSATAESIEEKIKEMEALEDKSKEMEEPRELEISLLQLQHDKNTQQERQKEIYESEEEGEKGTTEEMKEVSELVPESSSEETTAVAEDEFTSYHPLPTKKSEEQSQTSSAGLLSKVQDHGISTAAASIEEKTIGVVVPEDAQNLTEEASLKEESRDLKPSQLEPRLDNNVQKKSLEEVHEAEGAILDEPSKLQQPEHENEKREARTDFMLAEVTKEQIKEEKEDANAKNRHAITLDEAATKESHQENKLKDEDKMIAKDAAKEGELGVTSSQKESITSLVEDSNANSGIHREEEKTCDGNSENQKSREADSETMISTIKTEVQEVVQETMQVTEVGVYAKNVDSEVNRHDGKATEETVSAKFSLFDMMQRSTREKQVAKELTGEETSKERQTEETEKAAKSDEEEEGEEEHEEGEDEQKKNESSGSDAPVMVEASRDIDIKFAAAHKKSHNILSGVGSKVKHSIIKVKKAITGKSSHQKQHSPKSSTA